MKILLFMLLFVSTAFAEVYQVDIKVCFDNEQDAKNLITFIENNKARITNKTASTNFGPTIMIPKSAVYHRCHHDEIPPLPCEGYIGANI